VAEPVGSSAAERARRQSRCGGLQRWAVPDVLHARFGRPALALVRRTGYSPHHRSARARASATRAASPPAARTSWQACARRGLPPAPTELVLAAAPGAVPHEHGGGQRAQHRARAGHPAPLRALPRLDRRHSLLLAHRPEALLDRLEELLPARVRPALLTAGDITKVVEHSRATTTPLRPLAGARGSRFPKRSDPPRSRSWCGIVA
jgi:hypothetical protein